MKYDSIQSVITQFYAALRSMDADAWVELFIEDAIVRDPVGTPALKGRDQLRSFLTNVLSKFDSFSLTEKQVFVVPNAAAIQWCGAGRGKNGRDVEFEGIDVMTFDADGRIASLDAYWDPVPAMSTVAA